MYRHHVLARVIMTIIVGVVVAGCAHAPRSSGDSETLLSIRDDYLKANPGGRFNDFIRRGEVVKGMSLVEVLASWGVPDKRIRTKEKDVEIEYWAYVSADEISGDWVQHTFVFEHKTVVAWEVERHVARNRSLTDWQPSHAWPLPTADRMPRPDPTTALKR